MISRLAAAALAAALLAGCASASAAHFRGTPLAAEPAPDFTLTSDTGTPWTLSRQHGKVVALFFGYTHCDDTCPDTLAKLGAALRKAGGSAREGEIAFVTVDPGRDTVARMHAYLRRFPNDAIVGLTGTSAQIAGVERSYHVWTQKQRTHKDGTDYDEAHSSFTFLIDSRGDQRVVHDDDDSQASFASDFRTLLQ